MHADPLAVAQTIDAAVQPGHFFVAPPLRLTWAPPAAESIPWEIFRGRLLDAAQTRVHRSFLAWNISEDAAEPLLSVKLDVPAGEVHVARGVLCHVRAGHDTGDGVIESREVTRWTRELVGTIRLEELPDLDALSAGLRILLWQAVVGTSRLPLHSVEAPLPAFVLGQLYYTPHPGPADATTHTAAGLIRHGLHPGMELREEVKLLETLLRHDEGIGSVEPFVQRWHEIGHDTAALPRLLRRLFNDISLSPYTHFVDTALAWVAELTRRDDLTPEAEVDFLGHLLRQLGRHLTAYDLVTFHHGGANYPDALLLDAVLKRYLARMEERPELFTAPNAHSRRRALRQAALLRRRYEGHAVPAAPTSPGENARVMPTAHPRVPEEQLLHPHRRPRRLFSGEPLTSLLGDRARQVFRLSLLDLADATERTELGIAVFIDRPLGFPKAPAEPDLTPLLAHEAHSASIAERRGRELTKLAAEVGVPINSTLLAPSPRAGLPHTELADSSRPVASLLDVRRVADDFVIVRTLPGGLTELWRLFDLAAMRQRFTLTFEPRLVAQVRGADGAAVLGVYDELGQRRIELQINTSAGYRTRSGVEYPAAGLRVLTVWEDGTEARRDVREDNLHLEAGG